MADVTVIRGGTIVDGTGSPGVAGDVAISEGRIVGIGQGLSGDRAIDAAGCVVAPGFIDIHTHYDAQVFWDPALTPSCYHGVTTVVAGNCGFSIAPTRPKDRGLVARTLEKVEDMDPASLDAGIPWEFETFPEYLQTVERHGTAHPTEGLTVGDMYFIAALKVTFELRGRGLVQTEKAEIPVKRPGAFWYVKKLGVVRVDDAFDKTWELVTTNLPMPK